MTELHLTPAQWRAIAKQFAVLDVQSTDEVRIVSRSDNGQPQPNREFEITVMRSPVHYRSRTVLQPFDDVEHWDRRFFQT